jgi:ribonuclease D
MQSTVLDLQMLLAMNETSTLPGLKTCAARFSVFPLSKTEQCSNWGQRPLRQAQIDYAGLDAAILLVLLSEEFRRRDYVG